MTYTPPTVDDLVMRYPAFCEVDPLTIQYWLTDALRYADDSWPIKGDIPVAQLAVTAHHMVLRGLGKDAAAEAVRDGTVGLRRIRSGSLDIERLDTASSQTTDEYQTTPYGPEYVALLQRNKGGTRVTAPGTVCGLNAGFNGYAGPLPYPASFWPN